MSDQIEAIKKLYAKQKEYKIPIKPKNGEDQVKIFITPLSLEDMDMLKIKDNSPINELAENAKKLFAKSMGCSEEDAGKISFEFMIDIFECIMDANNFNEEDVKNTGIKEFIAKKKKQLAKENSKDGTKSTE